MNMYFVASMTQLFVISSNLDKDLVEVDVITPMLHLRKLSLRMIM